MHPRSLNILDQVNYEYGLISVTPSSSVPTYISTKNVDAIGVLILVKNATTVTGSAITLKQATAVAGTGVKALSFTNYYARVDTATNTAWTRSTAASDTFTTDATNSKNSMYFIPLDQSTLDTNNGFDCVRAGTGDATATTITVLYVLKMTQGGNPALFQSVLVD